MGDEFKTWVPGDKSAGKIEFASKFPLQDRVISGRDKKQRNIYRDVLPHFRRITFAFRPDCDRTIKSLPETVRFGLSDPKPPAQWIS